jgi:hypothetical protein
MIILSVISNVIDNREFVGIFNMRRMAIRRPSIITKIYIAIIITIGRYEVIFVIADSRKAYCLLRVPFSAVL